jgi:hypothetical protein
MHSRTAASQLLDSGDPKRSDLARCSHMPLCSGADRLSDDERQNGSKDR